jgi:hypothetical protein
MGQWSHIVMRYSRHCLSLLYRAIASEFDKSGTAKSGTAQPPDKAGIAPRVILLSDGGSTIFAKAARSEGRAQRLPHGNSPLFCLQAFKPTGDPDGAEVAGATIPEHGHTRIRARPAQMSLVQKNRIESLPQFHRRSRFS